MEQATRPLERAAATEKRTAEQGNEVRQSCNEERANTNNAPARNVRVGEVILSTGTHNRFLEETTPLPLMEQEQSQQICVATEWSKSLDEELATWVKPQIDEIEHPIPEGHVQCRGTVAFKC
ncbi:hypothetical protein DAPPUDRAFT_250796 [Daphnia pulex]|uniref:Uncharacterized protein n=1 Tax=Daphnia pulex TaxID=6669 RepID=E9GZA8_DAPPU|nr:hypothetical protein DAPPUDRAFT_250796 [Daphnia pulex]|eukprot:EFX75116.1 hypothetical protein DAPPUDRAFT_250796 [Daphnia pulex]